VRLAYKTVGEGPRNLLPAARLGEGLRTAGTGLSEPSILENSGLLPLTSAGMATRTMSPRALQMSVLPETPLPSPNATNARKLIGIGFSMSGRFVQYLPLLSPERVEALVIIAGAPATAMELPEEVIADWVGRAGDRERLRQVR